MGSPMILFALLAVSVQAQTSGLRPNRIVQFADHLVQEGRFREAVLEYDRALFYFPDEIEKPAVYRKLLTASILGKDFLGTLDLSRRIGDNEPCIGGFFVGRAEYGLENYAVAQAGLARLRATCPEPEKSDAAYWEGVADMRLQRWADARIAFAGVGPGSSKQSRAHDAVTRLELPPELPRRDPALAGLLNATLPGAGYLYVDSPKTALTALLVNGLFLWGTVASARTGNNGAAAVLGLFELGWYSGGIYGGIAGAHRFNRSAKDTLIKPFEID